MQISDFTNVNISFKKDAYVDAILNIYNAKSQGTNKKQIIVKKTKI